MALRSRRSDLRANELSEAGVLSAFFNISSLDFPSHVGSNQDCGIVLVAFLVVFTILDFFTRSKE